MIFLTALAVATTQPPQTAKTSDCKPMLTLASREPEAANVPRDPSQRRGEQAPSQQRRCITLASA